MSMSDFFTAGPANAGVRVPLFKPDGTPSDQWLHVHGVDSDAFRNAELAKLRKLRELGSKKLSQVEQDNEVRNITRELLASLVSAWSFPEPCTFDNVVNFFRQAPQIEDAVDRFSAKRDNFFKTALTSSATGTSAD